ncbi:MAG: ribulose-phosphate 3-epimerase, partial [Nanoarchaeota archaeon]
HIDLMDGEFVKSKGIKINQIPNLKKYNINSEAHLMTINPGKYISQLKKKGFNKIIFHYEAIKEEEKINNLIKKIKSDNMKAIIAINPLTNIDNIIKFFDRIDGVLLMGVYPGKEHQRFISKVYQKIRILRKISKNLKIQVDGGVNLDNIGKLKKIGVDYINSGSFIANAKNPKKVLRELKKIFL